MKVRWNCRCICCPCAVIPWYWVPWVLSPSGDKLPKPKLGKLRVKGKAPKPLHHCELLQGWVDITTILKACSTVSVARSELEESEFKGSKLPTITASRVEGASKQVDSTSIAACLPHRVPCVCYSAAARGTTFTSPPPPTDIHKHEQTPPIT